jgi:hypothetical protein
LPISVLAIEVLADQIVRRLIGRKEYVMGSYVPDSKEAVSSIPHRSSTNLAAGLGASASHRVGEQDQDEEEGNSHGGPLDESQQG